MIRITPPGMRSKPLCLRQGGFTLVTGIFLFVVLAALAAFIIGIRLYQDSSISLDTLGSRALAAARTGVEWGAYNSLRNNVCAGNNLALGGSLTGYVASVTCTRVGYNEAGAVINIDTITANACNQPVAGVTCPNPAPGANYAERQMTITVGQP